MSSEPVAGAPELAGPTTSAVAGQGQPRKLSGLGLGALVIFALVLVVYWPALHGGFVWDDALLVGKNPLVKGELGLGLVWFRTDFPLTTVALWAQWLLWGNNPAGYHIVNVVLHGLNAVLLWRLLARLRAPGAWLAGALFAIHPVCVASGAWISEQKNTLSLAFYLGSIFWYLGFEGKNEESQKFEVQSPNPGATSRQAQTNLGLYFLSLLAFVLALLSKTSTVMLPVVLLGLAWWRRGRVTGRDLARTGPFFALALGFGLMTVWFQAHGAINGATVQTENFLGRLAGAGWAVWFYLGKALLPVNLNLMYPRWEIVASAALSYVPLLLWAGVLGVCWWFRRSWGRHVLFGLFCFTVTLFPVLGFFDMYFLAISRVSDHFQYLPITAVLALVAAEIQNPKSKIRKPVLLSLSALLVGVLSVLSMQRARTFATDEGLWRDTLERNPGAWSAHNNMGCILAERQQLDAALAHFETSLRLHPRNAQAHDNIGQVRMIQGRTAEAEAHFAAALEIKPADAQAHRLFATALAGEGRYQEALFHLREVLRLEPDSQTRLQLAGLLHKTGDVRQALAELRQVLAVNPDLPEALNNTAWLLAAAADDELRDGAEAVRLAERACRLTGWKQPAMVGTLAAAYAEAGRFPEALTTAQKATDLARAAGNQAFAAMNQKLLESYRSGKAWHERSPAQRQ